MLLILVLPFLAVLGDSLASSVVNVAVDDVVVHLEEVKSAGGSGLGEHYRLDKRKSLAITCRAEVPKAESSVRLSAGNFDWRRLGANESLSIREPRASYHTECTADGLSCISTLTLRSPVNEDVGPYECHVAPKNVSSGQALGTIVKTGAFQSRPIITMVVDQNEKR